MRTIQLAVFVDRGHRELPIEANFIGKKITTKDNEVVEVRLTEIDGEDAIYVMEKRVKTKRLCWESRNSTREEILEILDTAETLQEISTRPIKKVPTLRGKDRHQSLLRSLHAHAHFFRDCRQTAFRRRRQRYGVDQQRLQGRNTDRHRPETLDAMAADCVVIRHCSSGAPHTIARMTKARVDQCAAMARTSIRHRRCSMRSTIRQRKGRLDGLKVAIIGDIAHSRVARSNAHLLTKFGSHVWLCSAPTLMPVGVHATG